MSNDELSSAQITSAAARKDEAGGHYFDAAYKYESIVAQPDLSWDSTEAHLLKAVAHMDAARCRFYYGQTLTKTPELYESNRVAIANHLNLAQSEIRASIHGKLLASVNLLGWGCEVGKIRAQSFYLQGMLNNSPDDLNQSIQEYQYVAKCEPAAKLQIDNLTSHISSVSREMSHSPLSGSEIMKDISAALHLAGTEGDFVSLFIQRAYDYRQSHQTQPAIAIP